MSEQLDTAAEVTVSPITRARARPSRAGRELLVWYLMRITGVALFVLALAHFSILHFIWDPAEQTAEFIAQERWNQLFWRGFDWLLLMTVLFHGFLGVRTVVLDYVHRPRVQTAGAAGPSRKSRNNRLTRTGSRACGASCSPPITRPSSSRRSCRTCSSREPTGRPIKSSGASSPIDVPVRTIVGGDGRERRAGVPRARGQTDRVIEQKLSRPHLNQQGRQAYLGDEELGDA